MTENLSLQSATLLVDYATIRAYADMTNDFNPVHLDEEFAAKTPMGGVIAHGTMSICLLWQALYRSFGAAAFDAIELDIRFVKPVRIGETITAGGSPVEGYHGKFDMWVRGEDGADRIVGVAWINGDSAGLDDMERQ
jgi:3-hydroxybutyryl-CoA dehydratase